MNYTKKSFTVTAPGSKSYADNWERTFRGPPKAESEGHTSACSSHENGLFCDCQPKAVKHFWRVAQQRTSGGQALDAYNVIRQRPFNGEDFFSDGRPMPSWDHHGAGGYTFDEAEALVDKLNGPLNLTPEQAKALTDPID